MAGDKMVLMNAHAKNKAALDNIVYAEDKYNDYEYPRVSIILPTYNNAEKLSLTLDSILEQHYPDFEVIIVDAASKDRTLEVVKNYRNDKIKIFTVSWFQRYEMVNRGISQASGEYINILFPGDFYIQLETLHHVMEMALDNGEPDLVFCGTLLRDGRSEPKILLRPFTMDLLKRGQQPTSLQSCWFKTETLRNLGKFNTQYTLRGGYDLMCRFLLSGKQKSVSLDRVLTDYDLRLVTLSMVYSHFVETFKTIWHYFGFYPTVRWFFTQKDFTRMMKIWLRRVKIAFVGQ